MAAQGNLKDISLASLISVNCNEINQARLRVNHAGQEATLFFQDGNIVHAAVDMTEGEEAVYKLLAWEEGEFWLERGVPAPKRSITANWTTLLLEGATRIDEGAGEAGGTVTQPLQTQEPLALDPWVRTLRRVPGVSGVVLVARDGTVLAHNLSTETDEALQREVDPEPEGAVAVFVGNAATQMGEAFSLGAFRSGVVEMGSGRTRVLVLDQPDYFVGLLLAEKASPALVTARVAKLLE